MSSPASRSREAELRTGFVDLKLSPPRELIPWADLIGPAPRLVVLDTIRAVKGSTS